MCATPYASALVLGLGLSGAAAAQLLLEERCQVTVADRGGGSELEARAAVLRGRGADIVLQAGDLAALPALRDDAGDSVRRAFDVCILSPGIPVRDPWLAPVRARGIEIVAELELGASRCAAPLLAITGSNGKSTFARFCGDVLEADGYRCAVAGNYGLPLCSVAARGAAMDWVVVEVSSFQLETVRAFAPRVGVVLNVQPDHLDRHGTWECYVGLKARLLDRMGPEHTALVHDAALASIRARTAGHPAWVTFGAGETADYRYRDGHILYREDGQPRALSLRGTPFDNDVMGLTAAAVLGALHAAGVRSPSLVRAGKRFTPLPHRMQALPGAGSVRFVDDSKATNLSALCAALRAAGAPVRLIAGGLLKEKELEATKEMLAKTATGVYLVGDSANQLQKAWGSAVECVLCGTLEQATRRAWRDARPGETILLSPGCASFDQFASYAERGNRFQEIVASIRKEKGCS